MREKEKHKKAFLYYYNRGNCRTYREVAEHYGVSYNTVSRWGVAFKWQERKEDYLSKLYEWRKYDYLESEAYKESRRQAETRMLLYETYYKNIEMMKLNNYYKRHKRESEQLGGLLFICNLISVEIKAGNKARAAFSRNDKRILKAVMNNPGLLDSAYKQLKQIDNKINKL